MNRTIVFSLTLIAFAAQAASGEEDNNKPNVLLIMADDLGYECLGCNGGTSYATPHLDRLAKTGVRFRHCYVNPICTPTRVALMTGRYNFRNYADPFIQDNTWERVQQQGAYGPDLCVDYLCDFFERHQDRPFFAYYPMALTHFPFKPTPDSPAWQSGDRHEDDWKKYMPDMVAYMDKLVGRLVGKLEELGIRDNTLIMFLGVSFLPRLLGAEEPARDWVLVELINEFRKFGAQQRPAFAGHEGRYVRNHRWKLYAAGQSRRGIPFYRGGQLYDLQHDLREQHPIPPGGGGQEAETARQQLQAVFDEHPWE